MLDENSFMIFGVYLCEGERQRQRDRERVWGREGSQKWKEKSFITYWSLILFRVSTDNYLIFLRSLSFNIVILLVHRTVITTASKKFTLMIISKDNSDRLFHWDSKVKKSDTQLDNRSNKVYHAYLRASIYTTY